MLIVPPSSRCSLPRLPLSVSGEQGASCDPQMQDAPICVRKAGTRIRRSRSRAQAALQRLIGVRLVHRHPRREARLRVGGHVGSSGEEPAFACAARMLTRGPILAGNARRTAAWDSVILRVNDLRAVRSRPRRSSSPMARADMTKTSVRSAMRAATSVGARVDVVIAGPGGAGERACLWRLAVANRRAVLKLSSNEE
jgi:hypothetical protein